jgi:signal transduction histidine kinase
MHAKVPLAIEAAAVATSAGALWLPMDRPLRAYQKVYWEVTMSLSVVVSILCSYLVNGVLPGWNISLVFGGVVYAFASRPLILVVAMPAAQVMLTLAWRADHPLSPSQLDALNGSCAMAYVTGLTMTVAAATLEWALRRAMSSEGRLREVQAKLLESEKTSALGRVLAQVSHEINNPINVIKNNIPPMREYLAALGSMVEVASAAVEPSGPRADEVRRARADLDIDFILGDFDGALTVVQAATDRVEGIQSDLRTFLRGEAPKLAPMQLNDALRQTISLLKRSFPQGVAVQVDYGDLPVIVGHQGQLNQVLTNLLQNAADAIGVDGSSGEIVVTTRAHRGGVRVDIADSGPGIRPEIRQRIFEPFFTTKDVGKGTGLGLAVCRQIVVENHGGTIELASAGARGARFILVLPAKPVVTASGRAPLQPAMDLS